MAATRFGLMSQVQEAQLEVNCGQGAQGEHERFQGPVGCLHTRTFHFLHSGTEQRPAQPALPGCSCDSGSIFWLPGALGALLVSEEMCVMEAAGPAGLWLQEERGPT